LKELRKSKNLTLKELATELNRKYDLSFSDGQLSNYENGKRTPRDKETWQKLADYFNVSVPYIMGLDEGYLDIGTKAFNELVNQVENGVFEKKYKYPFYESLHYFDEKRKNELVIEACKKYFDEYKNKSSEITNGLLITIADTFLSAYLFEAKSNSNYLEFIEDLLISVEDEMDSYPVVELYSVPDPTQKNDYLQILEYSGAVNNELQKEATALFDNFKESIHLLKNKYPKEFHENEKEFHYFNEDNTSGFAGLISETEVKTAGGYTKEELLKALTILKNNR
jgi:transcriptional regulator with XRE-family HTH domain